MGYARNIGRIGALAVALGVGYAVADAPAFARPADGSISGDSSSAQTSPSRSAAKGRTAAGPSPIDRPRASAAQSRSAATNSPAGTTSQRVSANRDSSGSGIPAAAVTRPVIAVSVDTAPAPAAVAAGIPVVPAATTAVNNSTGLPSTPQPLVASISPVSKASPTFQAAPAAPQVRAATSTTQLIADTTGPLVGDGSGDSPSAAPLMWATMAWTRREARGAAVRARAAAPTATLLAQNPDLLAQNPDLLAQNPDLLAQNPDLLAQAPNLLVNPGAELGDPSLSGFSAVTIPGWTLTGTPTVIEYGTPRNLWPIGTSFKMPDLPSFLSFPKAGSGPADGGNQFFGGGDIATGTLTQTVDLRGAAAEIDQGATTYNLSGWLGGFLFDHSGSSVKVNFLDDNKTYLGDAQLQRVGPLERWFQTGFKQRSTAGILPTGTRYAQVVLTLEDRNFVTFGIPWLLGGVDFDYNNAYADNISFTIDAALPAPPDPIPPVSTVGELDHVFMVYMENKGYTDITGSTKAPFLNSLIDAYGSATQYHGLTHPSLPNYYPVIGGTDFGLTYNCATPCIDAATTLVSNIEDAGKTWKGYAQSLQPGADPLVASGDYSPDQLPFPAFKSIANDPQALANVVPLEQMAEDLKSVDTAPNYAWFAANEDFNGEGPIDFPWGMLKFALSQLEPGNPYNIPALDQFLSETVPVVINSEVWKDPSRKSALVVTFDEDNNNTSLGFGNEGNRVVFVVIPSPGAVTAGMRSGSFNATNHYNHYSLLRFIEDSLSLPTLTNNDKFAAPLNEFWEAGQAAGTGPSIL